MRSILILTCLLLSNKVLASNDNAKDSVEYIISNGEILYGKVILNFENSYVLLHGSSGIKQYIAKNIERVRDFDPSSGKSQTYYSLKFAENSRKSFFQVLSHGKLPLLYREGVRHDDFDGKAYPPFFVFKNGSIFSIPAIKKDLLKFFDNDERSIVKEFIKSEKTDLNNRNELVSLFDFYNTLGTIKLEPIATRYKKN